MQIVYVPIEKIIPYSENPRINDDAVEPVLKSIQEFGWRKPVVLDKDSCIVCGDTRYKAAQRLGMKEVPCTYAYNLTPEQAKKYRIMDNKAHELASWNRTLLEHEIEAIGDESVREYFRQGFRFYSQSSPEDKTEYICDLIFTKPELDRFLTCLSKLQEKYPEARTKGELLVTQIDKWNEEMREDAA